MNILNVLCKIISKNDLKCWILHEKCDIISLISIQKIIQYERGEVYEYTKKHLSYNFKIKK